MNTNSNMNNHNKQNRNKANYNNSNNNKHTQTKPHSNAVSDVNYINQAHGSLVTYVYQVIIIVTSVVLAMEDEGDATVSGPVDIVEGVILRTINSQNTVLVCVHVLCRTCRKLRNVHRRSLNNNFTSELCRKSELLPRTSKLFYNGNCLFRILVMLHTVAGDKL